MRFTKGYSPEQIQKGKDCVEKEVVLKMNRVPLDLYSLLPAHKIAVRYVNFKHDPTLLNDPTALGRSITTLRKKYQSNYNYLV